MTIVRMGCDCQCHCWDFHEPKMKEGCCDCRDKGGHSATDEHSELGLKDWECEEWHNESKSLRNCS